MKSEPSHWLALDYETNSPNKYACKQVCLGICEFDLTGKIYGKQIIWPDECSPLDIIPVDYVSRAVARLVREPASAERTLHYAGARGLRLADIGRALQAAGYDLELRPFAEWKQELRRFSRQPQNALRPLAPLFLKANARLAKPVPDAFLQPPRPRFDSAATRAFLGGLGVPAPAMDDQLFARYCDYFVRVGWAPPAIETQRGAAAPAPAALPQANA